MTPSPQTGEAQGFGGHVMLDCRHCNPAAIGDVASVYAALEALPALLGMHKIIPPYVFPYEGLVPEDKGITGVVLIAESHLTFHSFVEKDYFFMDVFSCKPFDVDAVEAYVIQHFGVQDCQRHYCQRGEHFPRS